MIFICNFSALCLISVFFCHTRMQLIKLPCTKLLNKILNEVSRHHEIRDEAFLSRVFIAAYTYVLVKS